MTELTERLLAWFQRHQRALPWRETADPYRIWVSEVMLQQTRVEAVILKYQQFVESFPDAAALASADEEEVLGLWQGLGYYSRARRLHQAAQILVHEHAGRFPDYQGFRGLPGVGEYTADAVYSIAFGRPVLAVDGNVLRVGARLFCLEVDILSARAKKAVRSALHDHVAVNQPGVFNQALMDLGSAVCVPRKPRCEGCPAAFCCEAKLTGRTDELPIRGAPSRPRPTPVAVWVIRDREGHLLLRRRRGGGFLQGLWEFPWWETESSDAAAETEGAYGSGALRLTGRQAFHEYTFSHKQWLMDIREYVFDSDGELPWMPKSAEDYAWVSESGWANLPTATAFRSVFAFAGATGILAIGEEDDDG